MFCNITSGLAAHLDATDDSFTEWLFCLSWAGHSHPTGSKMGANDTPRHFSDDHRDKRATQPKSDTDDVRPSDPESQEKERKEKKDSTPATVALLARVGELPAELQKMVYDHVIQLPTRTRISVDKHFRLPSVLHVNSALRQALFSEYVTTNRFHFATPDLVWAWVYECIGTRGHYNIRIRLHDGTLHATVFQRSTWSVIVGH